ncbi:MAG: amidase [Rhodopseudomonas sp.]|uniref:amidase n=1 Tax=Rhodopseudomonas sp. TaxID=1078 RepID=UPI001812353A|nr:amidase [Rhodopseudomonas sp.]NVN87758.1 amidase [Rhodopseudomonas sp.]
MAELHSSFSTATELNAALRAKKVSAVELAKDAIDRIERYDANINAICVRDFERGLQSARAADLALSRGGREPLLGIPMTIKESFNLAGTPTTWGFPPQKNFIAADDALAVQRVKAAGGVVLAKTNVPIGLGDWQSYNDIYGTTNNPFDLGRTPGGSSGGSSAALAAGYGALSLGSDIGGSLRVPAHYCGIYAHKPTFALCPARGHTPPPLPPLPSNRDLSVIGPMARSAADLSLLLDVIAGPDPIFDGIAYRLELPAPRHTALKDFRVLLLDNHPLLPTGANVRQALQALASGLSKAGVTVTRETPLLPDLAETSRLYVRMLMSFLAVGFPSEIYAGAQAEAARLDPKDRSLAAEQLRGITLGHRDWLIDDGARTGLRAQWRALFEQYDAVICPVMPTPAYPHDHSEPQEARRIIIDGVEHPYTSQLVWPGIATLPGLPSTAIPVAMSPEGLPIGVQIVGPWLEDRTPLKLAELIEREFGGFKPPPALID